MSLWLFIPPILLVYLLLLGWLTYRASLRRRMARKYNQFVHQLYSKEGREVPSLISRIQYRYVMDYNDYLSDYRILKVFFKPLEVPGGRVPFTDSSLYIPSIKR